ncbi:unnamed protein product [Arabis nemorensis]|uniref:Uncharacterized protein n=1 Tax=Arabis nemorensis TaxID=586526 RepID=A0A565CJU8_9BRAS|nr:unnamed protein product [Arabis nemorensis]
MHCGVCNSTEHNARFHKPKSQGFQDIGVSSQASQGTVTQGSQGIVIEASQGTVIQAS